MAARTCARALALFGLCAAAFATRECLELTITENTILNETFNGTWRLKTSGDEDEAARYSILNLWDQFPRVLVPVNGTTEQCRRDSRLYLERLDKLELWALKMFDATAKPPSGILSGNGNQYGDFDECLSIDGAVRGKYCLASLEMTLQGDSDIEHLDFMVHSGHYIRSNVTDMGHRVPRFSSILWGVCMPSSCSSYDLEDELSHRLSRLGISVKVHNTMCSVKNARKPYSFAKTLSITFFLAIIMLLSLGTLLDDGADAATNFEKLLNAFSLKRNFRKLFDLNDSQTRVKGLDSFRGLNALALLLAHKSMAIAHNSYVNKGRLAEIFGMHWAVLGRSAILYTDSFLYLSGFLNAHNLLQELERKGTIDVKGRLISRWFRLFPLFLSLMLFCTYILPDVNSGPQWNLVVEEHSRVCEKNMWKSFLFIHNYFGFENMVISSFHAIAILRNVPSGIFKETSKLLPPDANKLTVAIIISGAISCVCLKCLTHTHQIGMDMQLYVATLPLMFVLWRWRTLGWSLVLGIAAASTVARYLAIYAFDISMVVYYGISVQKLLDAAKFCYILPTHRATIYLIGVIMAYVLRTKRIRFKLSTLQTRLLWCSCLVVAGYIIIAPYKMGLPGYEYEHFPAAMFAAFSPVLWGLFMSVAHWAICNDYAGLGTSFVEASFFKFFNKIAYGVYLTQFPIFFYYVGIQRHSGFYSSVSLLDMPEFFVVFVMSILTTVTIEMPFNEVYRIYFGKSQTKLKDK